MKINNQTKQKMYELMKETSSHLMEDYILNFDKTLEQILPNLKFKGYYKDYDIYSVAFRCVAECAPNTNQYDEISANDERFKALLNLCKINDIDVDILGFYVAISSQENFFYEFKSALDNYSNFEKIIHQKSNLDVEIEGYDFVDKCLDEYWDNLEQELSNKLEKKFGNNASDIASIVMDEIISYQTSFLSQNIKQCLTNKNKSFKEKNQSIIGHKRSEITKLLKKDQENFYGFIDEYILNKKAIQKVKKN